MIKIKKLSKNMILSKKLKKSLGKVFLIVQQERVRLLENLFGVTLNLKGFIPYRYLVDNNLKSI